MIALAEAGHNLVIAVGFAFSAGINSNAGDYPDTQFAIIDGFATCGTVCGLDNDGLTNVTDLTFKEQEGSFLVGAAAGIKADELGCDTVGFLGGQTGPLIEKFQAGYEAGVAQIDPASRSSCSTSATTRTAFNDAVKGEALSTAMYDDGACIIYHAAGASGAGLFNAAVSADKLAIGVDSDQYQLVSAGAAAAHHHVDAQAGRHRGARRDPGGRRRLDSLRAARSSAWPRAASTTPRATRT